MLNTTQVPEHNQLRQQTLNTLMNTPRSIANKSDSIEFSVSLEELLGTIVKSLDREGIKVRRGDGVRLVGSSAANLVLGTPLSHINDVDVSLFLSEAADFRKILKAQERAMIRLVADHAGKVLTPREVFDQFFIESLLVNTDKDCWSLISVGSSSFSVDIKVVHECSRSYAFTVDSFEVVLKLSEDYLEVQDFQVRSSYANYVKALLDLLSRRISTDKPEEIHRGFFRYCLELAKGGVVSPVDAQYYTSVFTQSFYEEFGAVPLTQFSQILDKFLSKHQKYWFGILSSMYFLLSSTGHERNREILGVVMTKIYSQQRPPVHYVVLPGKPAM